MKKPEKTDWTERESVTVRLQKGYRVLMAKTCSELGRSEAHIVEMALQAMYSDAVPPEVRPGNDNRLKGGQ